MRWPCAVSRSSTAWARPGATCTHSPRSPL